MDKIQLSIQYTADDLQRAYLLHLRKTQPFRSRLLFIMGILLLLMGGILVTLQFFSGLHSLVPWFFVIYGIITIAYYQWKIKILGKSAYKKLDDFHHPFEFTISDESIQVKGKQTSSDIKWDSFIMHVSSTEMILLYPNKMRFIALVKKYFSEEEFEQLCKWVKENVNQK